MAKVDGGNTLLTYSLITAPSPLQASPSAVEQSLATLTFVVSCPHNLPGANVAQILIGLPVRGSQDPDATELTATAPPASAATIVSSGGEAWVVAQAQPGVFTFRPRNGVARVSAQGLTIVFTGIAISPLVGTAAITVREWVSVNGAPPNPDTSAASAAGSINVAKFPSGFHVSGFRATSQLVDAGGTVVLSWVGSPDATYTLRYDRAEVPVTQVRDWPSPPLYATTVFVLHASATQNGETVGTDRSITIEVAAPQVVSCETFPDVIGFGESFELKWRAIDADGVYLITGNLSREILPPVSDDKTPKRITPKLGAMYFLRAFRRSGGVETRSDLYLVDFIFRPPTIKSFKAQPTFVDATTPSALLSWEIGDAVSATLDGKPVPVKGTQSESPTIATSYELGAVWVNGEVTKQSVEIGCRTAQSATFVNQVGPAWDAGGWTIITGTVTLKVKATRVMLKNLDVHYDGSRGGGDHECTKVDETTWQAGFSLRFGGDHYQAAVTSVTADIWVDGSTSTGVNIKNVTPRPPPQPDNPFG